MIPSVIANEVPMWFWAILATGLVAILATCLGVIVKYVLKKNEEEWNDMRNSVTATSRSVMAVSDSVKDLVGTVKLHEYRINDNSTDIRDIQKQLNGHHIVKYPES